METFTASQHLCNSITFTARSAFMTPWQAHGPPRAHAARAKYMSTSHAQRSPNIRDGVPVGWISLSSLAFNFMSICIIISIDHLCFIDHYWNQLVCFMMFYVGFWSFRSPNANKTAKSVKCQEAHRQRMLPPVPNDGYPFRQGSAADCWPKDENPWDYNLWRCLLKICFIDFDVVS